MINLDVDKPQEQTQHFQNQDNTEQNSLLAIMALRIRRSLNLNQILNTTVAEVRQYLGTERVIICRLTPNRQGIVVAESIADSIPSVLGQKIQDDWFAQNGVEFGRNCRDLDAMEINLDQRTQYPTECCILLAKTNLIIPILQEQRDMPELRGWLPRAQTMLAVIRSGLSDYGERKNLMLLPIEIP